MWATRPMVQYHAHHPSSDVKLAHSQHHPSNIFTPRLFPSSTNLTPTSLPVSVSEVFLCPEDLHTTPSATYQYPLLRTSITRASCYATAAEARTPLCPPPSPPPPRRHRPQVKWGLKCPLRAIGDGQPRPRRDIPAIVYHENYLCPECKFLTPSPTCRSLTLYSPNSQRPKYVLQERCPISSMSRVLDPFMSLLASS